MRLSWPGGASSLVVKDGCSRRGSSTHKGTGARENTVFSEAHGGSRGQAPSVGVTPETWQEITLEQWAGAGWERVPKACLRTARTSPEAVGSHGRLSQEEIWCFMESFRKSREKEEAFEGRGRR